jgi:hypothetical protein
MNLEMCIFDVAERTNQKYKHTGGPGLDARMEQPFDRQGLALVWQDTRLDGRLH